MQDSEIQVPSLAQPTPSSMLALLKEILTWQSERVATPWLDKALQMAAAIAYQAGNKEEALNFLGFTILPSTEAQSFHLERSGIELFGSYFTKEDAIAAGLSFSGLGDMDVPALSCDNEGDYTLHKGAISTWITVDSISVHIKRQEGEGVVVDLFPNGREMEESLASTYAFFSEAELIDDDPVGDLDWNVVLGFFGLDSSFQYSDEQIRDYCAQYRVATATPAPQTGAIEMAALAGH